MGKNDLQSKAYSFALEVVELCKVLDEKREYVISRQLLRSGTSIGANIEEAQMAESKADFISKFSIAVKEAYETRFWLRIIKDSLLWASSKTLTLLPKNEELIRMLVSSIKTSKANLRKK